MTSRKTHVDEIEFPECKQIINEVSGNERLFYLLVEAFIKV